MSVYVGIDVHRKRSQVVVVTEDGTVQLNKNVVNGSTPFLQLIGDLPAGTPVAFEAAFGWSWLADLLEDYGFEGAPGAPAAVQGDRLSQAQERQGRRRDLGAVAARGPAARGVDRPGGGPPAPRAAAAPDQPGPAEHAAGNRIHAVAADHGYDRSASYWTGPGRGWLAELELPAGSREIVTDCLAVIDALAGLIDRIDGELHQHAKADPRVKVLRTLPGVGEFTALVSVAEIGDISRFPSARKLASWAGLTPTVRGSDLKVRHGHISKQGSVWLRWAMNQAAQTAKWSPEFAASYAALAHRRGKKIATIAIARKLLTRAWHLLAEMETAEASTPLPPP
jgi:transposase